MIMRGLSILLTMPLESIRQGVSVSSKDGYLTRR
jgi:hypothetical protein